MPLPEFMSPDHVAQMNRLLSGSSAVRAAAASLGSTYTMTYQLLDAPHGTEYWTIEISPSGMQFLLGAPKSPSDVTITSDWATTMRSAQAQKDGRAEADPDVQVSGDPALMARMDRVLEIARTEATVESRIPGV